MPSLLLGGGRLHAGVELLSTDNDALQRAKQGPAPRGSVAASGSRRLFSLSGSFPLQGLLGDEFDPPSHKAVRGTKLGRKRPRSPRRWFAFPSGTAGAWGWEEAPFEECGLQRDLQSCFSPGATESVGGGGSWCTPGAQNCHAASVQVPDGVGMARGETGRAPVVADACSRSPRPWSTGCGGGWPGGLSHSPAPPPQRGLYSPASSLSCSPRQRLRTARCGTESQGHPTPR